MNTKIIPDTTPPPPARPLFPAVFKDTIYGARVLVSEKTVTVVHNPSDIYPHVGYSWARKPDAYTEPKYLIWTRIDGPVTIQFNAP